MPTREELIAAGADPAEVPMSLGQDPEVSVPEEVVEAPLEASVEEVAA